MPPGKQKNKSTEKPSISKTDPFIHNNTVLPRNFHTEAKLRLATLAPTENEWTIQLNATDFLKGLQHYG